MGKQSVLWNPVVLGSWFIVPQVLKLSLVGMGKIEWEVGISIIDSVQFFSLQEIVEIMFHNWILSHSSDLSSSSFSFDAISEGEDILKSLVL